MYKLRRNSHEERLILDLYEIGRQGDRKMLIQALEAEVEAYVGAAEGQRDEHGRTLGARKAIGQSDRPGDEVPKRDPEAVYALLSEGYGEVLPLLYLHGLSSGDFGGQPWRSSLTPRQACRWPPLSPHPEVAGGARRVISFLATGQFEKMVDRLPSLLGVG